MIVLQAMGIAIIIESNLSFWQKARKECEDVKRYSIQINSLIPLESCENLKKYSDEEINRVLKDLPHSQ